MIYVQDSIDLIIDYMDGSPLAADTETYSIHKDLYGDRGALSPHGGRVSILTIQKEGEEPLVIDIYALEKKGKELKGVYQKLREAPYIIWANAKFDIQMLYSHTGFWLENSRCVVLLSYLISNATGSKFGKLTGHSLQDLCRDYLSIHISKGEERISDWGLELEARTLDNPRWRQKIEYAARDVQYLFPLYRMMMETISHPSINMEYIAQLEMDNIVNIAEMEYNGLPIHLEVLELLKEGVQRKKREIAVSLCEKFGLATERVGSIFDDEEIIVPKLHSLKTLNNPEQLAKLISRHLPFKISNVQSETLKRLLEITDTLSKGIDPEYSSEDEEELYEELHYLESSRLVETSELIQQVLEYKGLLKQEGMDLSKYIDPITKRVHSSYNGLGGSTGRMSSNDPNAQQISTKLHIVIDYEAEDLIQRHS